MKQSHLFTKTLREAPKDEVSKNAEFLIRAGYIDKLFAGVYSILPLGLRVVRKIEAIIREELNAVGGQELLLPALHPIENYEKTGRDAIDVLFFTEMHDGKKLALGQSHEEVVTPLLQKYVRSYKDLPKSVYQFQTKFRNELRAKSGIMRGREFRMKDMYSFHTNQEDLDAYYDAVEAAYVRIFDKLGLGEKTLQAYASGGTFSKYSHEFQTVTEAGEDLIYVCNSCDVGINKEILEDLKSSCPECGEKSLEEKKAIEVGNIFKLADRFTNAFDFGFAAEDGSTQPIVMGCYGIGITRTLGAIAEVYNDERGLIWPESVSPFDIHLVSLQKEDTVYSQEVYDALKAKGYDVLFDDRNVRAGEKFADSDLIGIPTRLVVSDKLAPNKEVEVKKRSEKDPEVLTLSAFLESN